MPKQQTCHSQAYLKQCPPGASGLASQRAASSARRAAAAPAPPGARARPPGARAPTPHPPRPGRACGESGVALANELRYRSANVSATGSCMSITVLSSGLSADVLCLRPGGRASARRRGDCVDVARLVSAACAVSACPQTCSACGPAAAPQRGGGGTLREWKTSERRARKLTQRAARRPLRAHALQGEQGTLHRTWP